MTFFKLHVSEGRGGGAGGGGGGGGGGKYGIENNQQCLVDMKTLSYRSVVIL